MILWDKDDTLWLLTPEELAELPDGVQLEDIDGAKVIKGIDRIDDDTRYGYLAYGVRDPDQHELRDTFMIMRLKT